MDQPEAVAARAVLEASHRAKDEVAAALKARDLQPLRKALNAYEDAKVASGAAVKNDSPEWEEAVKDVASRGVSVAGLIDLYASLKEWMPHFDPHRSTTRDVVRGAVIPATRGSAVSRPVSYATLAGSAGRLP